MILDFLTLHGQDKYYLNIYSAFDREVSIIDLRLEWSSLTEPELSAYVPTTFLVFPISYTDGTYIFSLISTLETVDGQFMVMFCTFSKDYSGSAPLTLVSPCLKNEIPTN